MHQVICAYFLTDVHNYLINQMLFLVPFYRWRSELWEGMWAANNQPWANGGAEICQQPSLSPKPECVRSEIEPPPPGASKTARKKTQKNNSYCCESFAPRFYSLELNGICHNGNFQFAKNFHVKWHILLSEKFCKREERERISEPFSRIGKRLREGLAQGHTAGKQ